MRFFSKIVEEIQPRDVLDIGAGDAWFASSLSRRLADRASVSCFDPAYTPKVVSNLRKLNGPEIEYFSELPKKNYDMILLLDVLEHVEDDLNYLNLIKDKLMIDGGHILISLPAWMSLFSGHDKFLGHYRRYSPAEARKLVANAGLELVREGALFHFLYLFRNLQKIIAPHSFYGSEQQGVGSWKGGALKTSSVEAVLELDHFITRSLHHLGVRIPGLSWWALCRKSPM